MRTSLAARRHCRMIPYLALTTCLLLMGLHYSGVARIGSKGQPPVKPVKIHVVEEHHEVLPYWFDAAKRGLIPQTGNVLLHIDGHSDDAPPQFTKGYPRYRFPRNKAELRAMLQSNDMFIQAAILAGMYKKFIWVWPKWDKVNHEDDNDIVTVEYGEYRLPGATEDLYCACRTHAEHGQLCFYMNRTALEDNGGDLEDFEIKYDQCIKKGDYIYEEVHEDVAIEKMKTGTWFEGDDSIVLDIDEDYFGCESAGMPLVQSGAPWALIETVSALMDTLICPRRTKHENEAEDFLMPIIKEAIKICKNNDITCEDYESQIQKYADRRLKEATKKKLPFICTFKGPVIRHRMRTFVKHLLILSRRHLQAVANAGLCMMTTPKSNFFNMKSVMGVGTGGNFHICTGFNEPNDTVVIYHSPDATDVNERLKTLHSILVDGVYPNVKLTTICRSVRDGYTPRGHFETIERGILNVLRTRLGRGKYDIYYDRDLLGGPSGWPTRHQIL